jgi:hypothetical protein
MAQKNSPINEDGGAKWNREMFATASIACDRRQSSLKLNVMTKRHPSLRNLCPPIWQKKTTFPRECRSPLDEQLF